MLYDNGADFKKRDTKRWPPMSIAISYKDKEFVRMIYDFYLEVRRKRGKENYKKLGEYLSSMKDLYIELDWKVTIPIFSFLCPNDTIKLWKRGDELRADFTFVDYKTFSVKRNHNSLLIRRNKETGEHELFKANHVKKEFYKWSEPFEEDEIELIINDLMTQKRGNGAFKLLECKLLEQREDGQKVYEEVNGWKAQKYELKVKVKLDRNPTELIEYFDLNEDNYLDPTKNIVKNLIKISQNEKGIGENLHIKNSMVTNSMGEVYKEKNMEATVWVVENCPLNSRDAVNLLESVGPANQFMGKIKEFFDHPDLQKIIEKNGFPIQITIPYNFFISITFSFTICKVMDPNSPELVNMFKPFDTFAQHKRKDCQKLYKNYKTRLMYANIK